MAETTVLRVSDIEHFHWSLAETDVPSESVLDAKPLSLAAAVELAIIEVEFRKDTTARKFNFASICPVFSAVKAANWPLSAKPSSQRTGDLVVMVLPTDNDCSWWNDQLRILKSDLTSNQFPPKLSAGLTGAVAEMVDNAWLHSASSTPALLAYQVRNRRFAFSVADIGIGILQSLKQNPRYDWLQSSREAIQFAIQPGVSRLENGGMGFTTMLKSMADIWGNARIRTGQAALLVDGTQEVRSNNFIYLPQLPGLHVSVRCSLESRSTSPR